MNFGVLFRKEILEQYRTYRWLIVLAVMLLFGLASPLLIKFLPEIIASSSQQLNIQLPVMGAKDAIQSYISYLGQFGLLIAVLVSMGAIALERERRTAIMTLSKPVGFGAFIMAKLVSLAVLFGVGLILSALVSYLYTVVLLGSFNAGTFILINLLAALYLLVCISISLMYSAFFRNQLIAGGAALATLIVLVMLSNLPGVGQAMPNGLMNWANGLSVGNSTSHWSAVMVSIIIVIAAILTGWQVLKRREL